MQKGHLLQFSCQNCKDPIIFSVLNLEAHCENIECAACGLKYNFNDATLIRQLKKFEKLCHQIHDSEEILSNTSVGIYDGDKEFKIPYKILLTRLNSTLDLMIGDRPLSITFRIEPRETIV